MSVIGVVALVYMMALGFMFVQQRNMMYFPGGERPAAAQFEVSEIVSINPSPALKIEGWYWPAKPGFETIVFFHGNGQAYDHWMYKLGLFRQQGYGALHAEYRGYGGNPGSPTESGLYEDAKAYMEWLIVQQGISADNIILYGESLGTGVAVHMASLFPVKAMILESPYSSIADVAQAAYPFFPVHFLMTDQYRSIEKVSGLEMPKLLLHAAEDDVIPVRLAEKLFNAMIEPKTFVMIEGARHNNLYDYGASLHVLSFLSTITMGPAGSSRPDNDKE